jgi:uncharacterized membrane protein
MASKRKRRTIQAAILASITAAAVGWFVYPAYASTATGAVAATRPL